MKTILYTVAKNSDGDLVKASDADKVSSYFCPICNNDLTLRKSGKTDFNSKRPHFAHKTLTPNCTPETVLHFAFKNLLAKKIQYHIDNSLPLNFSWECNYCSEPHSGNLLKKIRKVYVEYNLTFCQPDIVLFDKDDKVFGVIEIVVTHKPEENVLKYYEDNNIILIQINLTSDQDIDKLESEVLKANTVTTCLNPKCSKCGHFQHKTKIIIIDSSCWKCNKPMKVAIMEDCLERGSTCIGPDKFTDIEIESARSKGVIIKEHYSKTIGEKYLANTCSHCGTFIGEFYLIEHLSLASDGELTSKTFDEGYHCKHCISIIDDL